MEKGRQWLRTKGGGGDPAKLTPEAALDCIIRGDIIFTDRTANIVNIFWLSLETFFHALWGADLLDCSLSY